jgi:hypothetical protein
MIRNFLEMQLILFAVVAATLPIFFIIIWGAQYIHCKDYQMLTGKETHMAYSGCYIKHGTNLIPYSEYKLRAITNEE